MYLFGYISIFYRNRPTKCTLIFFSYLQRYKFFNGDSQRLDTEKLFFFFWEGYTDLKAVFEKFKSNLVLKSRNFWNEMKWNMK